MEITNHNLITVRPFIQQDLKQLQQLMYELAVFEGYAAQFTITENDLETYGLTTNPRFYCFVAHASNSDQLLGMAVVHLINWTFDLKPTMVLKELFVKATARGNNIGMHLMKAVAQHAKHHQAPRLKWLVLKNNLKAKNFYQKLGATEDIVWVNWEMNELALDDLSES